MKIIFYKKEFANEIAQEVSSTLKKEELVILPTDTVYGLMALATSDKAVSKLYEAKKRPRQKSVPLLINSIETAENYIGSGDIKKIALKFWPGPLTVVAKAKKNIAGWDKLGLRIPDDSFLLKVLKIVEKPLAASSANIAGKNPALDISQVSPELSAKVAIGVDKGVTKHGLPSTVVEIKKGEINFIREGPIKLAEIKAVISE